MGKLFLGFTQTEKCCFTVCLTVWFENFFCRQRGERAAYLGAISWVVYNRGLGFLEGGRRHFTMQGEGGWGGHQHMMPTAIFFHGTKQTYAHTTTKNSTATQSCWDSIVRSQSRWAPSPDGTEVILGCTKCTKPAKNTRKMLIHPTRAGRRVLVSPEDVSNANMHPFWRSICITVRLKKAYFFTFTCICGQLQKKTLQLDE